MHTINNNETISTNSPEENNTILPLGTKIQNNINTQCSDVWEIDMSTKMVDTKRKNLIMRNINSKDYQNLTQEQIQEIYQIFKKTFREVRYNNIGKLFQVINEKKNNPQKSFIEILKEIDFSNINEEQGTNCVGFSDILKAELAKINIQSYVIGFQSTHPYLEIGHTGLVIPFLNEENQEDFIIIDLNNNTLGFKKDFQENNDKKYPFSLITKTSLGDHEDHFNPYVEFLNPHETMNKDVMRVRNKHSIIKTLPNGKKISFNIAMKDKTLRFMNAQFNYKKEMTFEKFLDLKNQDESHYREFSVFMEDLGENPDYMYTQICDTIMYADEFQKTFIIS